MFVAETKSDKAYLEDLIGRPVSGYRAPAFSLTEATRWVVDELPALGFSYSSSVLPAASPLFGFAAAPRRAFRWPNGLLELPAPVARLGPLTVPYLGGVYLRYLPWPVIERQLRRRTSSAAKDFAWTYCHPFDFSPGERLYKLPYTSWPATFILWRNRRGTLAKFRRLVPYLGAETFGELIEAGTFADCPAYGEPSKAA